MYSLLSRRYVRSMLIIRMLGPLEVVVAGATVAITAPMQRAVLAVLALARSSATKDHLIDALWDDPPAHAANAVQQYVSALRRQLGREQIVTAPSGYDLNLAGGYIDVIRFQQLADEAARRTRAGDLGGSHRLATQATSLVRGGLFADMPDVPFVRVARASLERTVLETEVLRLTVGNDVGRSAEVLPEAEELAARQPLDEAVAVQHMRALAGVGRPSDALDVYALMRVRLANELGIEPGEQLRSAQSSVLQAASVTVVGGAVRDPSIHLPHPSTPLRGRVDEVDEVEDLLHDSRVRIITMTGPGGVGKTRLALELAWRAMGSREVVWVPLGSVQAPELVLPTVAAALGVNATGQADLIPKIARMVRGRDLLLLLDNLEHLMEASSDLSELLAMTDDGLQVLVTSREAMRIGGERVYSVGSLPTSGTDTEPSAAVALFWERAEAANPNFRRDRDQAAVADICRRLDGLPLAIELAAARTNLLQPAAMVERLTHRLTMLTTGTRDAPARQRSLRSCLAWSVDLLNEDERRLFSVMSVFAGGATLTSLEAVCAQTLPGVDPLSTVDSLIAKNLLRPADGPAGTRLWMLETIREYAAELLATSGTGAKAHLVHARHYHDLIADAPSLLPWPPRTAEEARLRSAELPNARAALRTLMNCGETVLHADLVVGLASLLRIQGFRDELHSYTEALLERTDLPVRRRIELLYINATRQIMRADPAATEQACSAALKLLEDNPDAVQEAAIRGLLANVPNHPRGEFGRQEELALARDASLRSRDPEVVAMTVIVSLGYWPDELAGQLEEAVTALATAQDMHNEVLEVWALVDLSEVALSSPDPDLVARAEQWAREAFTIAMRMGNLQSIAVSLCNAAGASLLGGGDARQAASDLRRSLEMERRVGSAAQEIELLLRLAAAEAAQENTELSAFLHSAGLAQSDVHGIELSPTNQRILETFLGPVGATVRTTDPQLTLAHAVEVALGEHPVPTSWVHPTVL